MISKEMLKRIIFEQKNMFTEDYILRDKLDMLSQKAGSDDIIIISGIRRCGKSVLLNELRKIQKENMYYLNFDDERLIEFTVKDFETLHEVFIDLFGEEKSFYFDEIQNIKGWETFIRRLHDYRSKIYITGSNANLLSKELGTRLTGRYAQLELYPANFKEYLDFYGIKLSSDSLYEKSEYIDIKKLFSRYLKEGGFFKYLKNHDKDFFMTLYENILYRDIIARYSLSHIKSIKDIFHYLVSNVAKEFSYTTLKLISDIASITTIKDYISYMEDSYLLFTISLYDRSLKKQLVNPKKAYVIDTGLADSISFRFSEDIGRILENVVFLELKRENKEIYYHKDKKECDFIIKKNLVITEAIQVTRSLNDPLTRKREIDGLMEALEVYGLDNGLILTEDEDEDIIVDNKRIIVLPIWKWLCKKNSK